MNYEAKSLAGGVVLGFALGLALIVAQMSLATPKAAPEPAPACSVAHCSGAVARPAPPKPFVVACPYCRNPITVVPPATGAIGEVKKP